MAVRQCEKAGFHRHPDYNRDRCHPEGQIHGHGGTGEAPGFGGNGQGPQGPGGPGRPAALDPKKAALAKRLGQICNWDRKMSDTKGQGGYGILRTDLDIKELTTLYNAGWICKSKMGEWMLSWRAVDLMDRGGVKKGGAGGGVQPPGPKPPVAPPGPPPGAKPEPPKPGRDGCPPGEHSHPNYENGKCHPEGQVHGKIAYFGYGDSPSWENALKDEIKNYTTAGEDYEDRKHAINRLFGRMVLVHSTDPMREYVEFVAESYGDDPTNMTNPNVINTLWEVQFSHSFDEQQWDSFKNRIGWKSKHPIPKTSKPWERPPEPPKPELPRPVTPFDKHEHLFDDSEAYSPEWERFAWDHAKGMTTEGADYEQRKTLVDALIKANKEYVGPRGTSSAVFAYANYLGYRMKLDEKAMTADPAYTNLAYTVIMGGLFDPMKGTAAPPGWKPKEKPKPVEPPKPEPPKPKPKAEGYDWSRKQVASFHRNLKETAVVGSYLDEVEVDGKMVEIPKDPHKMNALVKKMGISSATFHNTKFHPDVARAFASATVEYLSVLPHLKNGLMEVGSCQDLERSHGDISPCRTGTIAYRIDWHINGIGLNERFTENLTWTKEQFDHCVSTGYHPKGCDTVMATIDHEFMHAISDTYNFCVNINKKHPSQQSKWRITDQELAGYYSDWILTPRESQKKTLSEYAASNATEFLSEAWSEYRNSRHPGEVATKVGKRIEQILAKGPLKESTRKWWSHEEESK